MTELRIPVYPIKELRKKTQPITTFDDAFREEVKQLTTLLLAIGAWGLAAPQAELPRRFFVMQQFQPTEQILCLANPEIIEKRGEIKQDEACCSFPEVDIIIPRAEWIKVQYQDENGTQQFIELEGHLAIIAQHKIEHLNGVLFFDHLSNLKRSRLLKKIQKLEENWTPHCHDPHCGHEH